MEVCGSQEYMQALEEELKKIMLFQKELPLSLQLVTEAIDACRRRMETERTGSGSESVETSSEGGPFLEEFIPIRRDSDSPQEQNDKEVDKPDGSYHREKKADWLRSVQLWSLQEAEASPDEVVDSIEKRSNSSTKKRDASVSSCKEKRAPSGIAAAMADHGGAFDAARSVTKSDDKEGQLQKKARRSWSPELHRRFLHALQQLGGSHATPKHIKQLMKVDGLTNDEIKSHLQKYRLHARRAASPSSLISNSQPTQIVVVSGIWSVPELAAAAAAASCVQTPEAAAATIYTPMAATSTTAPATPARPWFPKTKK